MIAIVTSCWCVVVGTENSPFIWFPDIDECKAGTPCDSNAACANTAGSFTCTCKSGYSGNGTTCTGT